MLKISLSCFLETRHVEKNARHVDQKAAMLEEMPAMLKILPPCRFSGCHVSREAVMFDMEAFERKYPENLKQISGVFKMIRLAVGPLRFQH